MQIGATTPLPLTETVRKAGLATLAAARPAAADETARVHKDFIPAPPLRPNLQDYIDINRTLLLLRQVRV